MNLYHKIGLAAATVMAACSLNSCISSDYTLGSNLIPTAQQFDTYIADFPLEEIYLRMADSLSGYSNTRITVGAIRDEEFGLTTRSCALTLVPLLDTLDYGKNPQYKSFYFSVSKDTCNVVQENQQHILQNINVYELLEEPDFEKNDINGTLLHGNKRITKGIPMISNSDDSLSFFFSDDFGRKYMDIKAEDMKDLETYLKKFPGIYLSTDAPKSNGGRINFFNLQLGYNVNYNTVSGEYALLSFNSEYDGERKDTSFLFYLSPQKIFRVDSLLANTSSSSNFPQYCYNMATHETRGKEAKVGKEILVEGGGGLKPVVPASHIKDLLLKEVSKYTDTPGEVVINRATITFPFKMEENWEDMRFYPDYLNPTSRISYDEGVMFASLTDTSSSTEEPGEINRSLMEYKADATYHIQHILMSGEKTKLSNYDIWFLIMKNETYEVDNSSEINDYMNMLNYANYYNSMYGGYGGYGGYGYGGYGYGYGGYGYNSYGYGGYGYGNNYYTMAMMAAMSSSTSTTTSVEMDKDRFYRARLFGPEAEGDRHPMLHVVYSIPHK